jgi:hypothetical protein
MALAAEVAVTVTMAGFGTVAGAVYKPLLLIVPAVAVQVTLVLLAPSTVALNCWVFEVTTLALGGDSVTMSRAVVVALLFPPQPPAAIAAASHATPSPRLKFTFAISKNVFALLTGKMFRWDS